MVVACLLFSDELRQASGDDVGPPRSSFTTPWRIPPQETFERVLYILLEHLQHRRSVRRGAGLVGGGIDGDEGSYPHRGFRANDDPFYTGAFERRQFDNGRVGISLAWSFEVYCISWGRWQGTPPRFISFHSI